MVEQLRNEPMTASSATSNTRERQQPATAAKRAAEAPAALVSGSRRRPRGRAFNATAAVHLSRKNPSAKFATGRRIKLQRGDNYTLVYKSIHVNHIMVGDDRTTARVNTSSSSSARAQAATRDTIAFIVSWCVGIDTVDTMMQ